MLTNAWPWIGQALVSEGFQPAGLPSLGMQHDLNVTLTVLPLPDNAELRFDAEGAC